MENEILYQVSNPIENTILFESYDYDEILKFIEREGNNHVILDVVIVK